MTEDEWLTVKQVVKATEIPERSLYRIVENHSAFLRLRKSGRRLHIAKESLPVLAKIRDLSAEGHNVAEVAKALADSAIPLVVDVPSSATPVPTQELMVAMVTMLQSQREELLSIRVLAETQAQELATLRMITETQCTDIAGLREEVARLADVAEEKSIVPEDLVIPPPSDKPEPNPTNRGVWAIFQRLRGTVGRRIA